jgi:hypothetical protein
MKSGLCGIPERIIAHQTRESDGNVHGRSVVVVTSGSFETEKRGVDDDPEWAAKGAAASSDW